VAHAEQLLVRIAVDLDMVVRQPPPAAQEALAVAGDPHCDLPALLRVVERDPAVTRGLMRHASSVMFAAAGPPASLDDAVRRLGSRGVQVAVLAGMAEALLHGSGPYLQDAEAVWVHMVRAGPLARALGPAFGVPPDEAFLLGLLHDVGKLVLFDLLAAVRHELRREVELPAQLAADARAAARAVRRAGPAPLGGGPAGGVGRGAPPPPRPGAEPGAAASSSTWPSSSTPPASAAARRGGAVGREGRLTTPPARVEAAVARAG
jgi:hypothetical protein